MALIRTCKLVFEGVLILEYGKQSVAAAGGSGVSLSRVQPVRANGSNGGPAAARPLAQTAAAPHHASAPQPASAPPQARDEESPRVEASGTVSQLRRVPRFRIY